MEVVLNNLCSEMLKALEQGKSLDSLMADFERAVITCALKHCNGSQIKAGYLLKVKPSTLHYKMKRRKVFSNQAVYIKAAAKKR